MPEAIQPDTTIPEPVISGRSPGALPAGIATALAPTPSNPDAELIRLYGEFHRYHEAFLVEARKSEDQTPEEDRLYQAYWREIEAMYDIPAASLAGLAAKARVIKKYTLESDAMDAMAQSLVDDCVRLAGGAA